MKYLKNILTISCFSYVVFFFSCSKDSVPGSSSQSNYRSIVVDNPLNTSGDFHLSTTEQNELVIISLPRSNAEQVNKVWVAAFDHNINQQAFNKKLKDATLQVSDDKRYLTIKSKKEQYFIALSEEENKERAAAISASIRNSELITAFCFGITYQWGHYDLNELLKNKTISVFESIRLAHIKADISKANLK